MSDIDHRWALVLAAGDGQRLRRLTTTRTGLAVPKQFCSLECGPSLLHQALRRARSVAAPERTCAVVAAQHRQWWTEQLGSVPSPNVIVQPLNRGTANGILLPLLNIVERDPGARITLLPSDHDVRDEAQLAWMLRAASGPSRGSSGTHPHSGAEVLLLGLAPRSPDPELGYIVPGREATGGHFAVECFVEKPPAPLASTLIAQGALWNAFIIAAHAKALLKLFERRCPEVVSAMRGALRGARAAARSASGALSELYETPQPRRAVSAPAGHLADRELDVTGS